MCIYRRITCVKRGRRERKMYTTTAFEGNKVERGSHRASALDASQAKSQRRFMIQIVRYHDPARKYVSMNKRTGVFFTDGKRRKRNSSDAVSASVETEIESPSWMCDGGTLLHQKINCAFYTLRKV